MSAIRVEFERLSESSGLGPETPPRVRITGPIGPALRELMDTLPAHARHFDVRDNAWLVELTGPARLSQLARALPRSTGVEGADPAGYTISDPQVAEAVQDYARRLGPQAQANREWRAGAEVRVSLQAETVQIAFDYHRDYNRALRALPAWMRRFEPAARAWAIPRHPEALSALASVAQQANFPPDVQHRLTELAQDRRGAGTPGATPTPGRKTASAPSLG